MPCKDTPNFIANRIGSFFGATVQKITVEDDYTIEEVDALTGPLIGLPNSASFRLMDIVGLDVWAHVARNLYDAVPNDPWRERFRMPEFMQKMMERGWLGEKTRPGLLQARGRKEGNPRHRLEDARISSGAEAEVSRRRKRRGISKIWASGCGR